MGMQRPATVRQARRLRAGQSATERRLWNLLRHRRLEGLKFRRQVVIGPYIADFVCLRHRLIVEADGPFHDAERDAIRDAWLTAQRFRVLRFSNHDIGVRDWEVLRRIVQACETPHPSGFACHLLPQGEKDA